MEKSEIRSLIELLDDPDILVYESVKKHLIAIGIPVVRYLEKSWESSYNDLVQERIEAIVHQIQFNDTSGQLKKWANSETKDIIYGAFLVAKYQYPDLIYDDIKQKIDVIRQDIWLELNDNLTALEKTKIMNHILFDVHGYSGNFKNIFSPQNSFLNTVLETHKGNSISLALIYAGIAQQLNLPIYGINLPKNFILGYLDTYSNPEEAENEKDKILFYINPFSKGIVFGKAEILHFLETQKIEAKDYFFTRCSNIDFIDRLISSLIDAYERLGYMEKVNELELLAKALILNKP